MYYELALISVAIAAGYWGLYFVRGESVRTYGLMLLGAAALAGLGLYAHKDGDAPAALGLAGAIGVGAGACLLVVGPVVRATARRFAAAERLVLAGKLLAIADVLVPGSGVGEERALLAAMREIRDGNIEQTIGALTAAKDRAPTDARLAIDERIAMLYLAAYRWDDAIAHAEAHLFAERPAPSDSTPVSPAVALRRALGIAPPVWVELLGAYGYTGKLDEAARMLDRLEVVCAGRDDAAIWVHRGRMMFLALAGRVAAVEALVAPRHARHMSRSARSYWLAVAHDRNGDGRAALVAYEKARAQSRGRPRHLIDRALERMPDAHMIELPPLATELALRVEAEAPPAVAIQAQPIGPWATRALIAALLATAGATALFVGDTTDVGVLMRAGAMVHGFIAAGEWWRIVSAIFVHVGGLHLLVNVIGLGILGRLCEAMFGAPRMVAIFALAGIAGSLASYVVSPVDAAAGASAAVLGVLGATFVELTLHQRRRSRRNNVWGRLAIVTVAEVAVVLTDPVMLQWAHGSGLLVGVVAGLALSPSVRWAKISRIVALAITGSFAALVVVAAVQVVRTPLRASLGTPSRTLAIGDHVTLRAPAGWSGGDALHGPDVVAELELGAAPAAIAEWTAKQTDSAHHDFDQVDLATEKIVPLPPGWQGSELALAVEDPDGVGSPQRWRAIVAGKPLADGRVVLAVVTMPDTVARAAPDFFTALLASVDVH